MNTSSRLDNHGLLRKKSDPRIDNERTIRINQDHDGNILNIIRLIKYWNSQNHTIRIPSYMLECMVLSVYEYAPIKEIID